jgi:hypothetical protein
MACRILSRALPNIIASLGASLMVSPLTPKKE